MRQLNDLNRPDLLAIVEKVQGLLYLDLDERGGEFWNPDKPFDAAEVCRDLMAVLGRYGLAPGESQPFQPRGVETLQFVLYDYDARVLITTCVFDRFDEAVEVAEELNNVIVLRLPIDGDSE